MKTAMTESAYIMVRNLGLLTASYDAILMMAPGENTGITDKEKESVIKILSRCQDRIFKSIDTVEVTK